jgi:hypothetical protein
MPQLVQGGSIYSEALQCRQLEIREKFHGIDLFYSHQQSLRYYVPLQFLHIRSVHSDVISRSNIRVLPSPALTCLILEANPLDVVLWSHVNEEVR